MHFSSISSKIYKRKQQLIASRKDSPAKLAFSDLSMFVSTVYRCDT